MSGTGRVFVGFVILKLSILLSIWFWRNFVIPIGPEWLEAVVFFGGWAALLAMGGYGFAILVQGIKDPY